MKMHWLALTGQQHKNGGTGDVTRRPTPAPSDSCPECHKYSKKCYDEECYHWSTHICQM